MLHETDYSLYIVFFSFYLLIYFAFVCNNTSLNLSLKWGLAKFILQRKLGNVDNLSQQKSQ